jgi:ribokinase
VWTFPGNLCTLSPVIDVLVLGDVNPDLVLVGDVQPRFGQAEQLLTSADLVLGGSGAIVAHGLARLGTAVRMVAAVGSDWFAEMLRERLTEAGVDVTGLLVSPAATGLTVVLSPGADDRAILTYLGAIADLDAERAVEAVDKAAADGARHVHVSSLYLLPKLASGLAGVLRQAHDLGLTTSLDTNDDPSGHWEWVIEALDHVDVLLPNAREARALAARSSEAAPQDHVEAAQALARHGPTVVVKLGAEGALQVSADGTILRAEAPATEVVDATGAGDTLVAAYLDGRLRGLPDDQTLHRAVRAASLSTTAVGGTAGHPTAEQLAEEDLT